MLTAKATDLLLRALVCVLCVHAQPSLRLDLNARSSVRKSWCCLAGYSTSPRCFNNSILVPKVTAAQPRQRVKSTLRFQGARA
eukprot:2631915-Rhodomonas_salina.5